jgi:hypothetical protein
MTGCVYVELVSRGQDHAARVGSYQVQRVGRGWRFGYRRDDHVWSDAHDR